MFSEISPDVFCVDHRLVEGKNGIIMGARSVLAIDSCNYPDEGQAMADFIRSRGRKPDRLALTHGHGDHILGGAAFAGAEVFAHVAAPGVIREQLAAWAERSGESVDVVKARTIWPTITFTHELHIDLGGKHVRLFYTPGHSEDGICVYLEEARILFTGDTVVTGIVPAIGNGNSMTLESSLRKLVDMEIEVLVSGHGPVFYGSDRVREWIEWVMGYLSHVRARVRELLEKGLDPETAVDMIGYDEFIGDRLPADKHGMPKRHRSTVQKIIEEVGER